MEEANSRKKSKKRGESRSGEGVVADKKQQISKGNQRAKETSKKILGVINIEITKIGGLCTVLYTNEDKLTKRMS